MLARSKSLTIVSVTGHQDYAQSSSYAVQRSYLELRERIENLRCLLVSPERPQDCPDYIQHIPCKPFGYLEYSLFMIYSLGQLIDSDYCLIVQNDGWVVDGSKWRDEFFNYDYIGGPILNLLEFKEGRFFQRLHFSEWEKYWQDMPAHLVEYQNGGFCLRSRKLLNAPRELGLNLEIAPPLSISPDGVASFKWENDGIHLEDFWLCGYKRVELENYGIRFAPQKLAGYFATDRTYYQFKHGIPLNEVMGGHFGTDIILNGVNDIYMKNPLIFINYTSMINSEFFQRFFRLGYNIQISNEHLNYLKSRG
ncbi:hypothetical protein B0187_00645 [Haemophilus paracuniculus]|uniref:DUF5672 domain-containing protein n=1 Tax=Haemophilus paracuniculus TaxID=734 RepID=A0A1T0AW23_9PAST|nr:DUF5672 family protein [Haemophilus paracuniculus]OOS00836.1 hypothetical protein B0187_00645 [Haemophilus paracuniculus]